MYNYEKKTERFCNNGIELVRFTSVRACFEKLKTIDEFYNNLLSNCYKWCSSELLSKAELEYNEDPDPAKRFHYLRYNYLCDFSITAEKGELVCIKTDISLYRRRGENISYYTDAQVWNITNMSMLSPRDVLLAENLLKSAKKPLPSSVMLNGNDVMILENNVWKNVG